MVCHKSPLIILNVIISGAIFGCTGFYIPGSAADLGFSNGFSQSFLTTSVSSIRALNAHSLNSGRPKQHPLDHGWLGNSDVLRRNVPRDRGHVRINPRRLWRYLHPCSLLFAFGPGRVLLVYDHELLQRTKNYLASHGVSGNAVTAGTLDTSFGTSGSLSLDYSASRRRSIRSSP